MWFQIWFHLLQGHRPVTVNYFLLCSCGKVWSFLPRPPDPTDYWGSREEPPPP